MSVRLTSSRLTLRSFREDEFGVMWAETPGDGEAPDAPWPSQTREQLHARIASSGVWQDRVSLVLAVEAEGRLVGDVQARTSPSVFPPGVFEVGIELFTSARSEGYGTEAVELLTRYLFEEEQASRVQLGTDVDNVAMRRVAEKAGFTFEGVMRGFWPAAEGDPRDYALYARTRADHEGLEGTWTRTD